MASSDEVLERKGNALRRLAQSLITHWDARRAKVTGIRNELVRIQELGRVEDTAHFLRTINEMLNPDGSSEFRLQLKRRKRGKPKREPPEAKLEQNKKKLRDLELVRDVIHRTMRNLYRARNKPHLWIRAAENRPKAIADVAKAHGVSTGIVEAALRRFKKSAE